MGSRCSPRRRCVTHGHARSPRRSRPGRASGGPRKQPVLFGSSPNCDIVLSGPDVLPFHGRVRWKLNRYKVDASPEARYLIVNGKKMAAAASAKVTRSRSARAGFFMLQADEDDEPPPADDKTRIQAPPLSTGPPPGRQGADAPRSPGRQGADAPRSPGRQGADAPRSPIAPRPMPAPRPSSEPLPRMRSHGRSSARLTGLGESESAVMEARQGRGGGRYRQRRGEALADRDGARPGAGARGIVTSPLVIGLAIALLALVFLSVMLHRIIAPRSPTGCLIERWKGWTTATIGTPSAGSTSSWRGARRTSTSKARLFRRANVRQFATATGSSWSHALEAERAMVEKVGKEPAYRDSSPRPGRPGGQDRRGAGRSRPGVGRRQRRWPRPSRRRRCTTGSPGPRRRDCSRGRGCRRSWPRRGGGPQVQVRSRRGRHGRRAEGWLGGQGLRRATRWCFVTPTSPTTGNSSRG